MINNKIITVVLPAYNAERTLVQTYNEIPFDIVDNISDLSCVRRIAKVGLCGKHDRIGERCNVVNA